MKQRKSGVENKQFKDFTGRVVGKLTVVGLDSWHVQPSGQRKTKWLCNCECGNTCIVMGSNLAKETHTTSCGCVNKQVLVTHRENVKNGLWLPKDLIGRRFGRVVVTEFSHWREHEDYGNNSVWKFVCDCGKTGEKARFSFVENSSCGCYKSEVISKQRTTHGMQDTPTYKTWSKMKERCYLDSYAEKVSYQDRGITVCDRWLNSFENFLEDMGVRPEDKTLDRIDNDLGYYKENCRWADNTIQCFNRRKSSRNTSGRTGVQLNTNTGLYNAYIGYYKKNITLVKNVSFEEACRIREQAELKYYGWTKE